MELVTQANREPIKRTARRIGRCYRHTLELAKDGKLAAVRDVAGRWWSSRAAAEVFNGLRQPGRVDWEKAAQEALR